MRATYAFDGRGALTQPRGSARIEAAGSSIPVPIEGWDAVSPIAAMSPKRAVRLTNWFPQQSWIEIRKGHTLHSPTGSNFPVETVATYQGITSVTMFAVSNGTIYDVTLEGLGVVSRTGLSNSRFQYINYAGTGGNFLYMVNGADDPIYWDGSTWQSAVITGVSGSDIVSVNAHKNRLWFTLRESSDAAYLATDSIQGAATVFPLGGLFTKGGYLMAMGTWSIDAGAGPEDYAVFISSRGQVAIYNGSDPSDVATWSLVGVFDMGAPLGRRCLVKAGADLGIICIDGVLPLSKAMIFERAAVASVSLTQRIQRVMNESARLYGDNFGWQLISYPRGTRILLNVPLRENIEQVQYVMNTLSGAWCKFEGMNANCWELLNDDLFFGGNDGNVYQADRGGTDYSGVMTCDMMTSFNYYGERGRNKRWMMARALITTDRQIQPGIAFNVDFKEDAEVQIPATPADANALWDVALWDQGLWAGDVENQSQWVSVTGLGYCSSIRVVTETGSQFSEGAAIWGVGRWGANDWGQPQTANIVLRVNGFDLTYEKGAFI